MHQDSLKTVNFKTGDMALFNTYKKTYQRLQCTFLRLTMCILLVNTTYPTRKYD